jgi:CRP-like cAMP-binding protein
VATTRETVNRELREMMETGIIEKHGRTLVVPDVEKLRRLVVEPTEE